MIRFYIERSVIVSKTIFDLSSTNVMVEFRILGDSFDPDYITDCLAVVPSISWKKGDKAKK